MAHCGKPIHIWCDHGSNFVGASCELHEVGAKKTKAVVSEICSTQGITRSFIFEHASNFDGLWEAAIKSTKKHLNV